MIEMTRTETPGIVPRFYGLAFRRNPELKIFDNPSTAALAFIAITSPEKDGGLIDMLAQWQERKKVELGGKAGYDPQFKIPDKKKKILLESSVPRLVETVRESIKQNHGTYNLFDCYGSEAVTDLILRGELLTAKVKSQSGGWHNASLKGAILGHRGQNRYVDVNCGGCEDSFWSEVKGGKAFNMRRHGLHTKMAETESYLQRNPASLPAAKDQMKLKEAHEGDRSLTFNFVDNSYLVPLAMDVLIAKEVLGQSLYSIDRRLLSPTIAPHITPPNLQLDIKDGRATFEVVRQKRPIMKLPSDIAEAQQKVDQVFSRELWNHGYRWQGFCLELGQPAVRYENSNSAVSLVIDEATQLPFYVVRDLSRASDTSTIFTPDYGPQNPFSQPLATAQRVDDRTRQSTPCYVRPALDLRIPEERQTLTIKHLLPKQTVERYSAELRKNNKSANSWFRELRMSR